MTTMKSQKRKKRPKASTDRGAVKRSLEQDKVRKLVAIVASALGMPVVDPRDCSGAEEFEDAFRPWGCAAELTLAAGAMGYPMIKRPTNAQVIDVMLDLLRAAGMASASDEIRLRTAMVGAKGELGAALRQRTH